MPRAIVIKDGRVLLHNRKKGEIIDNISANDIERYREFVQLYEPNATVEKQDTVVANNYSPLQEPQTTDEKTVANAKNKRNT